MDFIKPGDKKISAKGWNEAAEVVNAFKRNQSGPTSKETPTFSSFVIVHNETGLTLDYGAVLGVEGVPNVPSDPDEDIEAALLDAFLFDEDALLECRVPTSEDAGRFVVLQESCDIDGYAHAVVSGPAKVLVDIQSESDTFADCAAGNSDNLVSGTTGVPILWKDSGTGVKWAIVNLGGGTGAEDTTCFLVQQADSIPAVPATDWRTVGVRAAGSTVNGVHADNEATFRAIIPASDANYFVWLKLTINTGTGLITARTLEGGTSGWTNYPDQPAAVSGQAPAAYYILITDGISTSDDTDQILTLPVVQTTSTALSASLVVAGVGCVAGVFSTNYKYAHWRV